MGRRKTKEEFIANSINIHGSKYDYSKVVYLGNKTKVEIICKEHDSFFQTPNDHTGGHGCRKCSEENHINYNLKELNKHGNKEKLVDLYIIKLYSNIESFIKVGISKQYKKRHINIKTKSGYDYEELFIIPLCLGESLPMEKNILVDLKKEYKYIPKIKFPGYKECLLLEAVPLVLGRIKSYLIDVTDKSILVGKIIDWEYKK